MTLDPSGPRLSLQLAAYARAQGADVRAAVSSCGDSGSANAGDGGGTLVAVMTVNPHGLYPGDEVALDGTPYDGRHEVADALDPSTFLLLDTPFVTAADGGTWSPVEIN